MKNYFCDTLAVMPDVDFLLVIPAYREQFRLPPYLRELTLTLSAAPFATALVVVDDGSPSAEWAVTLPLITTGRTGNCEVLPPLRLTVNQGKGGAILAGWRSGVVLARWLAFVDADGAVSAAEVARVLGLVCETGKAAGYFASRNREAGKTIRRRWPRGQLGCVFAWLAGRLLGLKTHDSQCGFKVVEREWFRRIDARVRELGFCFDLDVWLALREQGAKVAEVPVDWQERAGGKLKLWRDGAGMLRQLWCLRKKYQVGKSGGVGH